MLQDVEAGRPIELEALLGAPREIARRAGVPTPQLDRLYAMTRLMAENLGLALAGDHPPDAFAEADPDRAFPSHHARRVTSSPSSRKLRVSPSEARPAACRRG